MVKTVQSGPCITYIGEKKSLCKLHHITCGALVPWTNVRKYLQLLTTQNLLISSNIGDDICYEKSDKGFCYQQLSTEIEEDLRPERMDLSI